MTISRRMAYLEELFANGGGGGSGGAAIDDLSVLINKVWSSSKVSTEFANRDTLISQIRTLLNNSGADLSGLSTTNKANLVAAINELVTSLTGKSAIGHTHPITEIAGVGSAKFVGRVSAGTGSLEEISPASAKAMLAITTADVGGLASVASSGSATDLTTGTMPAARMPQFTGGDVTTAGVGSVNMTIGNGKVTLAKLANLNANTIMGNNTGSAATPIALTGAQVTAMLNVATGALNGLMSSSDFTKLAGIAAGATLNSTDAYLLNRANHSGSQPSSTINIAATARFVGRTSAGAGAAEELTGTQATALLDVFTASAKGLVPSSGGNSSLFLRGDGVWATPPGGSGGSGSSGTTTNPITFTNTGTGNNPGIAFDGSAVITISYNTIGAAPQGQVISSKLTMTTGRLLGRTTAATGAIEEISVANGITLAGGSLGLGAIAPSSVAATGTVTGSNLSGTNTGDQTITLTGDVTGSGKGSFAATIGAGKVTYSKLQAASKACFLGTLAAGTFKELNSTEATSQLDDMVGATSLAGGVSGLVPAPAPGEDVKYLRGDGTWASVPSGNVTLTGDVTGSGTGSFPTTIAPHAVTFSKLQAAGQACVIGATASGDFGELAPGALAQMLPLFDSTSNGLVPASGVPSGKFLKDDGTWDTPAGGGSSEPGFCVTATGTGASQNITLSSPVSADSDVMVFVNGVYQLPTTDYTTSASTLTITTKNAGDQIVAVKPAGSKGEQGNDGKDAWDYALNFVADGATYIPAYQAMTIDQGNAAIGTGVLTYAKSTAAAPNTFTGTTLPATIEAGAWLRVTASGVVGYLATHLRRTA